MNNIKIDKILVTGRLYKEIQSVIEKEYMDKGSKLSEIIFRFFPEEQVTKEALEWADAYIAFRPTENFHFHNLKWVHALGAGVDSFLSGRGWKKDVVLSRTICSFGRKISEYCLSYILADIQQQEKFKDQQSIKKWHTVEPLSLMEQKVMILGTGEIGQELAKSLSFFGVKTIGVSLRGEEKQYFHKVIKYEDIKGLLPKINWLINTMPLTDKTEGVIDGRVFSYMKDSNFINVGRGKSVDEKALVEALDKGNLRLAVLDVFQCEPLPKSSELWKNPKIIITPHISAITSVDEAVECLLDTLVAIENGNIHLKNIVDIDRGY